MLCFRNEESPPSRFGLVVVDEAHSVFRVDSEENKVLRQRTSDLVADDSEDTRLLILSDLSQSEVDEELIDFPTCEIEVELQDVCRSTKRLAVAAMAFRRDDVDGIGCSHEHEGLQVETSLFRSGGQDDNRGGAFDVFAAKALHKVQDHSWSISAKCPGTAL